MKTYIETFDQGSNGWWGWDGNDLGLKKLEVKNGAIISRSPWWVDYNHAPPGAGYLHMVFCLNTKGPFGEQMKEVGGPNAFTANDCPLNFANAKVSVRVKGNLIDNGAKLVILIQGTKGDLCSGWMLTGQPIQITPDWSEQTIILTSDEKQWTCLGARHDRIDYYGRESLETILNNVNINIMFILFPLNIVPMEPLNGAIHNLRPERDYPVWRSKLPEGYVMLDTVRIDFA